MQQRNRPKSGGFFEIGLCKYGYRAYLFDFKNCSFRVNDLSFPYSIEDVVSVKNRINDSPAKSNIYAFKQHNLGFSQGNQLIYS
jgi:hypothetical protein